MSTQKHTDGPWKFRFESIDQEWAIVTTASGSIIANVNSDHHQKANARLIAAAPDLIHALRGMVCLYEVMNARNPYTDSRPLEALAAIAKAEVAQ